MASPKVHPCDFVETLLNLAFAMQRRIRDRAVSGDTPPPSICPGIGARIPPVHTHWRRVEPKRIGSSSSMQDFGKIPKSPEGKAERHNFEFGPFLLNSRKRILLRDGEPVPLTPKALEILMLLVENHGEVLVKDELMEAIWPDTVVEEGNLNRNISTLRKALGESPNEHQYIVTVPGRGYRFVADVEELSDDQWRPGDYQTQRAGTLEPASLPHDPASRLASVRAMSIPSPSIVRAQAPQRIWGARSARLGILAAAMVGLVLVAAGIYRLRVGPKPLLAETDLVLISDFLNSTGDSVFDETLKEAISVQLTQSPYWNILSDSKVRAVLQLMMKPPDTRLTPDLARDLCQRAGCKAYITGSISRLGNEYVVGLKAVNCKNGDSLAEEQVTADNKEHVLKSLDGAATKLREKLGESLSTLEKFDTPLEDATTSSLEALKAYSQGWKKAQVNDADAIPFFKHAIELDPNFASAYETLGACYFNLGESGLARENFTKAYDLRDRVSERERFTIAARYHNFVTGDLQKAIETYLLWKQAYPRSPSARSNLGALYGALGQYERSIHESEESIRLNPDTGTQYSNLILAYASLNRFSETKHVYEQTIARKIDDPVLKVNWFGVAFVEGDTAEMDRLMVWAAGMPEAEDNFLAAKSDAEAYFGHALQAREFSRQAVGSALRSFEKETAAQWQMDEALREAEFGNSDFARRSTSSALALTTSHDTQILAALAFARIGESEQAEKLANEIAARYPLDTLVNVYWLPVIRGAIELNRNNAAKAVEILQAAAPYELASPQAWSGLGGPLYPAYLRGLAFLRLSQADAAAAEFQKLVDHRGFMRTCALRPLAFIALARAFTLRGDTAKARSAYDDFFALWKDADPDIPILRRAMAEYAKLR
jgi:DNA-binding winged helix-turn-helix (wHTH) protein/Flp pilus assembly protein TadD